MVDSLSKILYKKDYTTSVDDYLKEYLGTLPNIEEINSIVSDYENLVVNDFVENSVNVIINNLMYKRISSNSNVVNVYFFNTLTDEMAEYVLNEYDADICVELPFTVLMDFMEENIYATKIHLKLLGYGYKPRMDFCKPIVWKKIVTETDEEGKGIEKVESTPIKVTTIRVNINSFGNITESTK